MELYKYIVWKNLVFYCKTLDSMSYHFRFSAFFGWVLCFCLPEALTLSPSCTGVMDGREGVNEGNNVFSHTHVHCRHPPPLDFTKQLQMSMDLSKDLFTSILRRLPLSHISLVFSFPPTVHFFLPFSYFSADFVDLSLRSKAYCFLYLFLHWSRSVGHNLMLRMPDVNECDGSQSEVKLSKIMN